MSKPRSVITAEGFIDQLDRSYSYRLETRQWVFVLLSPVGRKTADEWSVGIFGPYSKGPAATNGIPLRRSKIIDWLRVFDVDIVGAMISREESYVYITNPFTDGLALDEFEPPKWLYFIENPGTQQIKIGISVNPELRRQNLECQSGCSLQLLAVMEEGDSLEKALHKRFADLRVRGEWFRDDPRIRRFIAAHGAPPKIASRETLAGRKYWEMDSGFVIQQLRKAGAVATCTIKEGFR